MPKSIAGHSHVPRNGGAVSILTAPKADHARIRRSIAHAFSDKALREQEHYLQDYVNILITQLRRNASTGPLDMVEWYNFTTFDAIGGMSYRKSFSDASVLTSKTRRLGFWGAFWVPRRQCVSSVDRVHIQWSGQSATNRTDTALLWPLVALEIHCSQEDDQRHCRAQPIGSREDRS